ncbi:MAG: TetR/AcrR family transcriptional regulator [Caulobacteraceae bacterium]
MKSARKAKGDGHLRRAEILEAAERIFVTEGYEGATIRKIADEVGVSSTALYMHFRDKDEILIEICNATMEALLASNSEISVRPIDAVARVRLMLEAYVRFGFEHPNAYKLAFCSAPNAAFTERMAGANDIAEKTYARYVGVVREIAADGQLRSGDPDTAAQALWAACHGMVALVTTKNNVDWSPTEELLRVLLDSLLHGLIAD